MTETEMALLLEKQIAKLHEAGADMSMDQTFFRVGEWLLAFEGVYVMNRKLPGVLDAADVRALNEFFGEDMSELD